MIISVESLNIHLLYLLKRYIVSCFCYINQFFNELTDVYLHFQTDRRRRRRFAEVLPNLRLLQIRASRLLHQARKSANHLKTLMHVVRNVQIWMILVVIQIYSHLLPEQLFPQPLPHPLRPLILIPDGLLTKNHHPV